jgi:ligand-binding sensor domain-containing protein
MKAGTKRFYLHRYAAILVLLALATCGQAQGTATLPPATATLPPTAPLDTPGPTSTPTQPRPTATWVPLVTRTPVPEPTTGPTRVPESARCTTYQPAGTEGPIWDIAIAPDGAVWVAALRGVSRLHPQRKEWVAVAVGADTADEIRSITTGPDGTVWLASRLGKGVYRWDGASWGQLTSDDGLISGWVNDVTVAPDAAVWFATEEGASRWDEASGTWSQYTVKDWLYANAVQRVLFTPDGRVWFAHDEAMRWWLPLDTGTALYSWGTYGQGRLLATRKAVVSADGRLWVGQAFYDPETEAWADTVYRAIHLQALAVDGAGGMWIGRSDGAIYIPEPESSPAGEWLHLGKAQGLASDNVTVIALEQDNTVWFGTDAGITRCFLGGLRPSP